MSFPEKLLRGIRRADWLVVDETGKTQVLADAFEPDKKTDQSRTDGNIETSISWLDSPEVLVATLKDQNGAFGAAELVTAELERIEGNPNCNGGLSHERKATPKNPSHGNLLFKVATPPKVKRLICATLAFSSTVRLPT